MYRPWDPQGGSTDNGSCTVTNNVQGLDNGAHTFDVVVCTTSHAALWVQAWTMLLERQLSMGR